MSRAGPALCPVCELSLLHTYSQEFFNGILMGEYYNQLLPKYCTKCICPRKTSCLIEQSFDLFSFKSRMHLYVIQHYAIHYNMLYCNIAKDLHVPIIQFIQPYPTFSKTISCIPFTGDMFFQLTLNMQSSGYHTDIVFNIIINNS